MAPLARSSWRLCNKSATSFSLCFIRAMVFLRTFSSTSTLGKTLARCRRACIVVARPPPHNAWNEVRALTILTLLTAGVEDNDETVRYLPRPCVVYVRCAPFQHQSPRIKRCYCLRCAVAISSSNNSFRATNTRRFETFQCSRMDSIPNSLCDPRLSFCIAFVQEPCWELRQCC
jgi:hypothetical protein